MIVSINSIVIQWFNCKLNIQFVMFFINALNCLLFVSSSKVFCIVTCKYKMSISLKTFLDEKNAGTSYCSSCAAAADVGSTFGYGLLVAGSVCQVLMWQTQLTVKPNLAHCVYFTHDSSNCWSLLSRSWVLLNVYLQKSYYIYSKDLSTAALVYVIIELQPEPATTTQVCPGISLKCVW